jgi:hypothetical protein
MKRIALAGYLLLLLVGASSADAADLPIIKGAMFAPPLECAPRAGQFYAAVLTVCRA